MDDGVGPNTMDAQLGVERPARAAGTGSPGAQQTHESLKALPDNSMATASGLSPQPEASCIPDLDWEEARETLAEPQAKRSRLGNGRLDQEIGCDKQAVQSMQIRTEQEDVEPSGALTKVQDEEEQQGGGAVTVVSASALKDGAAPPRGGEVLPTAATFTAPGTLFQARSLPVAMPLMPPTFMPALCQLLLIYLQRAVLTGRQLEEQGQHQQGGKEQEQEQHTQSQPMLSQDGDTEQPPALKAVQQLQSFGIPAPMLLQAAAHLMVVGAVPPAQYQAIQATLGPAAALDSGQLAAEAPFTVFPSVPGAAAAFAAAAMTAAVGVRGPGSAPTEAAVAAAAMEQPGTDAAAVRRPGPSSSDAPAGADTPASKQDAPLAPPVAVRPWGCMPLVGAAPAAALAAAFGFGSSIAMDAAAAAHDLKAVAGAAGVLSGNGSCTGANVGTEAAPAQLALPALSWAGRGGLQSPVRLGLGRRLFNAITDQLPTNTELDSILPPSYGFSGVLYKIQDSKEVGAGLWDGMLLRDLGPYTSVQDARQSVSMSIKLLAAASAAAPPAAAPSTGAGAGQAQPAQLTAGPRSIEDAAAAVAAAACKAAKLVGGPPRSTDSGIRGVAFCEGSALRGRGSRGARAAGRSGLGPAVAGAPAAAGAAGVGDEALEADVMEAAGQLLMLRSEGRMRESLSPSGPPLRSRSASPEAAMDRQTPRQGQQQAQPLQLTQPARHVQQQGQQLPFLQLQQEHLEGQKQQQKQQHLLIHTVELQQQRSVPPPPAQHPHLQQSPQQFSAPALLDNNKSSHSGSGRTAGYDGKPPTLREVRSRLHTSVKMPGTAAAGPLDAQATHPLDLAEAGSVDTWVLRPAVAALAAGGRVGGGEGRGGGSIAPMLNMRREVSGLARRSDSSMSVWTRAATSLPTLDLRGTSDRLDVSDDMEVVARGATESVLVPAPDAAVMPTLPSKAGRPIIGPNAADAVTGRSESRVDAEAQALIDLLSSGQLQKLDREQLEALIACSSGPALLAALQRLPQDLVAAATAATEVEGEPSAAPAGGSTAGGGGGACGAMGMASGSVGAVRGGASRPASQMGAADRLPLQQPQPQGPPQPQQAPRPPFPLGLQRFHVEEVQQVEPSQDADGAKEFGFALGVALPSSAVSRILRLGRQGQDEGEEVERRQPQGKMLVLGAQPSQSDKAAAAQEQLQGRQHQQQERQQQLQLQQQQEPLLQQLLQHHQLQQQHLQIQQQQLLQQLQQGQDQLRQERGRHQVQWYPGVASGGRENSGGGSGGGNGSVISSGSGGGSLRSHPGGRIDAALMLSRDGTVAYNAAVVAAMAQRQQQQQRAGFSGTGRAPPPQPLWCEQFGPLPGSTATYDRTAARAPQKLVSVGGLFSGRVGSNLAGPPIATGPQELQGPSRGTLMLSLNGNPGAPPAPPRRFYPYPPLDIALVNGGGGGSSGGVGSGGRLQLHSIAAPLDHTLIRPLAGPTVSGGPGPAGSSGGDRTTSWEPQMELQQHGYSQYPSGGGAGGGRVGGGVGGYGSYSAQDVATLHSSGGRASSQPTFGASHSARGSGGGADRGEARSRGVDRAGEATVVDRGCGVGGGGRSAVRGGGGRGGGGGSSMQPPGGLPPAAGGLGSDSSGSSGGRPVPGDLEVDTAPTAKRQRHSVSREYSAVTSLVGLGLQEALAIVRQRQGTS